MEQLFAAAQIVMGFACWLALDCVLVCAGEKRLVGKRVLG
jgi:hypothetical protein